jgi:hypothetical protein
LAEAGEGDADAPSGVRMIEVPRPMSSQAPHILAPASGLANSPEAIRHTSVTCLIGTSRGEGFEIEEEICKAAGYRDANAYWHVATSEPMKALSFAHLLAVHLIDPTERLNEFDRRSLVRRRIESSLRFALKTGESWFIKDPLASDGGGTGDLKALMLHPRTAAKWLLSLPKRRDLVPPGLKAFLERSERPDEREVPPQPLTKSNRDLEVLPPSTLRLFYGLMPPLTKFEIAMREYGRERRLAERILAERDLADPAAPTPAPTLPPPASDGAVDLTKLTPQPAHPDKGDIQEEARIWRTNRIARFTEDQRRKREWINFAEIAEWCGELCGAVIPNEPARTSAREKLQRDLLEGDFEENGRSRVLYLHPRTVKAKMTRQRMQHVLEVHEPENVRSTYVEHCWLPRILFQRWLAKHHLPASAPRFQPLKVFACQPPLLETRAPLSKRSLRILKIIMI